MMNYNNNAHEVRCKRCRKLLCKCESAVLDRLFDVLVGLSLLPATPRAQWTDITPELLKTGLQACTPFCWERALTREAACLGSRLHDGAHEFVEIDRIDITFEVSGLVVGILAPAAS